MDTEGVLAPTSVAETRGAYEALGPAAQTVVREVAKAMAFDEAEYDERVTPEVVDTARDALFASLLEVAVGTDGEFASWRAGFDGAVHVAGSDEVDRVVWHAAPFAGQAVAATFHEERAAAVATLRRQAFGRIYREVLEGE